MSTSDETADGTSPETSINVGGDTPLKVKNVQELTDWLKKEQGRFNWINPKDSDGPIVGGTNGRSTRMEINQKYDSLITIAKTNNFEAATTHVATAFRDREFFASNSSSQRTISKLLQANKLKEALVLTRLFMNLPVGAVVDRTVITTLQDYFFEQQGLEPGLVTQRQEFVSLLIDHRGELEKLKEANRLFEAERQAIRKAYEADIPLHAARDYWRKKAGWHWGGAMVALTILILFIWCPGAYVFEYSAHQLGISRDAVSGDLDILPQPTISAGDNGAAGDGSDQLNWLLKRVASVGLLVAGLAWGLRLIIRILLSQLHLASDAGLRGVMIESYLALIKQQGASPDAKDREIVLQAIFRPFSTGLIKTDIIPDSVIRQGG